MTTALYTTKTKGTDGSNEEKFIHSKKEARKGMTYV